MRSRLLASTLFVALAAALAGTATAETGRPDWQEPLLERLQATAAKQDGSKRIIAGLPKNARFAHKTGTQQHRACHMGIANPQDDDALVILACAEALDEDAEAGELFEQVGEAIQELVLDDGKAEAARSLPINLRP